MDTGFSQSDILTIVGIVVGSFISAYGVFATLRQTKKRNLTYHFESRLVLDISGHPDFERRLTMFFDQKNVSRLSMVELTVWNSGNEVVDREMLVAADPLRIEVKNESQIVDGRVTKSSSVGCNVGLTSIEEEGHIVRDVGSMSYASVGVVCKRAELDFDYLNPGEGAKISVVHTGAPEDAIFTGALKGGKVIDYRKIPLVKRGIHKIDWVVLITFFAPILSIVYYWAEVKQFLAGDISSWKIPTGILIMVYVLNYIHVLYMHARDRKMDEVLKI